VVDIEDYKATLETARHGQLYVAASRTGACSTVMFTVLPYKPDDPFITVNLVYRHTLDYTIVVLLIKL
jgi:hypothetical protein